MRVYGSQMRANDPWVPLVHKIMRPGGLKDLLDMSGVKYTKRRG